MKLARLLPRTRCTPVTLAALAAVVALAGPAGLPVAAASEACDKCDIDGIRKEMEALAKESIKLTEQAAGKYGDAASDYEAALGDAKDLAGSLVPSLDVTSLCSAVDDIKGKAEQAMSALSGLINLVSASGNEADAAELKRKADLNWQWYLREQKCLIACCKSKATPPPLIQENPDVDFKKPLADTALRECLNRLSSDELRTLLADARAGKLASTLHADNIAAIKRLVTTTGTVK